MKKAPKKPKTGTATDTAKRHKNGENGRRRKNGTGTITEGKSKGTWRAMWYVYTPEGIRKRMTKTLEAETREDARKELYKLTEGNALMTREKTLKATAEKLEGVTAQLRKWEDAQPAMTLDAAWDAFDETAASKKRDPATQRNYGQWYGIFTEWLKTNHPEITELRRVDSRTAREYAAHLAARVRGTTYNRHFNALALVWATLAARDADGRAVHPNARLGANPFSWDRQTKTGIQRITLKRNERPHKRRDLTLEELSRILASAQGEMRLLIGLGFFTGLRLGDLALVDWGNVDRVNGIIATRSRKTDTPTETRIHPRLAALMEESETYKEQKGYLMPEIAALYNGGTTGRVKLCRKIAEVFTAAGIKTSFKEGEARARPDCSFHSLRHSYVTQLERVGATLAERQALAGHRTQQMAQYYTHADGARVLALPDIGAQTAENAPAALPVPVAADEPADGADAAQGRFSAFLDMVRGMTREELEKARTEIDRLLETA